MLKLFPIMVLLSFHLSEISAQTYPNERAVERQKKATLSGAKSCRLGPSPELLWPVLKVAGADLVSAEGLNWEIVHDFAPGNINSQISIKTGHQFKISAISTDTFKLQHFSGPKNARVLFAEAEIKIDRTKQLWARGRARKAGSTESIGEYFVFKIPDNHHNQPSTCEHPKSDKTKPCRTLHFEYFEDSDDENIQEKPVLDWNVVPISHSQPCRASGFETGDGDGDIGPDD